MNNAPTAVIRHWHYWTKFLVRLLLRDAAERIIAGYSAGMGRAIADAALANFYPALIETHAQNLLTTLYDPDGVFSKDEEALFLLLCAETLA